MSHPAKRLTTEITPVRGTPRGTKEASRSRITTRQRKTPKTHPDYVTPKTMPRNTTTGSSSSSAKTTSRSKPKETRSTVVTRTSVSRQTRSTPDTSSRLTENQTSPSTSSFSLIEDNNKKLKVYNEPCDVELPINGNGNSYSFYDNIEMERPSRTSAERGALVTYTSLQMEAITEQAKRFDATDFSYQKSCLAKLFEVLTSENGQNFSRFCVTKIIRRFRVMPPCVDEIIPIIRADGKGVPYFDFYFLSEDNPFNLTELLKHVESELLAHSRIIYKFLYGYYQLNQALFDQN